MRYSRRSAPGWLVFAACLALTQTASEGAGQLRVEPHRPIPLSLLEEHAELDASVKEAVRGGGAVGEAARDVLDVLAPHMAREQQLALPPLRLLPRLANHDIDANMADLAAVSERLRAELPALRREHVAIQRALETLWTTAWAEGRPEYAVLAQRVNRHLRVDEEVLYPAALVAGDYARLVAVPRATSMVER